MSVHVIILMVFIICLTGCVDKQKDNHHSKTEFGSLVDTSRYAILPLTYQNWIFKNSRPATLNDMDILTIEQALSKSTNLYNQKKRRSFIDLAKYKRQYFPVITVSGEKEVWIYCICEDVIKKFGSQF